MSKKLLVLCLLACAGVTMAATADKRPNILYCLADDWGWPHAGVYGDRVIRTPTFDRVAREGMRSTTASARRRPAPPRGRRC